MITSVEVFNKMRDMSQRTFGTRPRILLSDLAKELSIEQDVVLVLAAELENRGLINIHKTNIVSVSLTSYGVSEESPTGGFNSH